MILEEVDRAYVELSHALPDVLRANDLVEKKLRGSGHCILDAFRIGLATDDLAVPISPEAIQDQLMQEVNENVGEYQLFSCADTNVHQELTDYIQKTPGQGNYNSKTGDIVIEALARKNNVSVRIMRSLGDKCQYNNINRPQPGSDRWRTIHLIHNGEVGETSHYNIALKSTSKVRMHN